MHGGSLVGKLQRVVAVVVLRWVGGDDAFSDGAAEDLAQGDQAVVQRLATDPACGVFVGEVGPDPGAGDLAQFQIAEGGLQALAQVDLVVVVGRCLDPGFLPGQPSVGDDRELLGAGRPLRPRLHAASASFRRRCASWRLGPMACLICVPSAVLYLMS